jgi:hypothetical protein
MKLTAKFIILISLLSFSANSQDLQWLINNNQGKSNNTVTQPIVNIYDNFHIGSKFSIGGVQYPKTSIARNDLLVIYDDKTYYNTRNSTGQLFITQINNQIDTQSTHYFNAPPGKTIQYLYLTNVYEGDDPPDLVKALNESSFPSQPPTINLVTTSSNSLLTANHNPVKGKDFTLIVKLLESYIDDSGPTADTASYFLEYDSIKNLRTGMIYKNANYFNVSSVFTSVNSTQKSPGYPSNAFSLTTAQGKIKLIPNVSDNLFYNITPSASLDTCYPDAFGNPRYSGIFHIISSTGAIVATLEEPLMFAHDPNFLRVDSICQDGQDQIAYYHLQVKNTGKAVANGLSISLWLPNTLQSECIQITDWNVGGTAVNGSFSYFSNYYQFYFGGASLGVCDTIAPDVECVAYIKFKVKARPGVDLKYTGNSLRPSLMKTKLDGKDYTIDVFYDIINQQPAKYNMAHYLNPLESYRPIRTGGYNYTCRPPLKPLDQLKDLEKQTKKIAKYNPRTH